jgi:hypothetical protein
MHAALLATVTIRGTCRKEIAEELVAGGGFVPQSCIDSVQLTDSTIVPNAKKGYKAKSFIQFSFSSWFHRSHKNSCLGPLLHRSLREVPL